MRHRYLRIYLQDHFAMAWAGIDFCRRVIEQNDQNELGRELKPIVDELDEEATDLAQAMDLLDVEASRLKRTGARFAEKAGRLKFNGRLLRYSPLSRLLEVEFLLAAVEVRKGLWRTLIEAEKMYPQLQDVPMEHYRDRADRQLRTLNELHQKAVRVMLKQGWDEQQQRQRPSAP